MQIICNGERRDIPAGTSVTGLIESLDLNPATVVVECDGAILQKENCQDKLLAEGMVVELIRFVGGG